MILVILGVCIAAIIAGVIIYGISYKSESIGTAIGIIGETVGVFAFIVAIVLACCVADVAGVDERITMYEVENAKIESQIATVVEQYQKYETDIFIEVKPESAMTLVSLYPELKSDSLVEKQIEVYVDNNAKIKELKEKSITAKYVKWWLYFGGKGDGE